MTLVSDVGGLIPVAVGVGVVGSVIGKQSKRWKKGLNTARGKGYHNHTLEHSENARKTYLKKGKRLPQPKYAKKGKTYMINGKKSTFLTFK